MKNSTSLLALLSICLLAPWGLEAGPAERAAAREKVRDKAREHGKERADKNDDGEVDRAERLKAKEAVKAKVDTDGDGSVNDEERTAARDKARASAQEHWKKKADTDGDGVLSDEEKSAAKTRISEHAKERVEKRQENQEKRIEHGIEKGYLTEEEASMLQTEQEAFAAKAESLKADGALTKEEFHDLRTDLNEMSRDIWVQKHDTEGNQMPVFRVSKDCKLKAAVAEKLESGDVSSEEAKKFYHDMQQIKRLQKALASGELGEEEAAKAKGKYDELVGRYFECGE